MTILHHDCLAIMTMFEADSYLFDSIVCDPPYGLNFRSHAWDHGVPGVPYWEAALRVVVPGAFMVAFGGTRTYHRLTCAIEDAGWEIRDCLVWMYGQGYPKNKGALKPGWEPIVLARKPGPKASLQIDACRIAVADQKGGPGYRSKSGRVLGKKRRNGTGISAGASDPRDGLGRWPANVTLDELAADALDEQSGHLISGQVSKSYSDDIVETGVALGSKRRNLDPSKVFADAGGASRFFYVAKASRSERTHGGTIENNHSTVKPVALMRWLVRLVTPVGGIVLDPFCGSGSTGVACDAEGFDFVGIDNDEASANTAARRTEQTKQKGR